MARYKPSISIKRTKGGLQIIKKTYDELGNIIRTQIESVVK